MRRVLHDLRDGARILLPLAGEGVMRSMTDEGPRRFNVIAGKGATAHIPSGANHAPSASYGQAARALIRPRFAVPPSPVPREKKSRPAKLIMLK